MMKLQGERGVLGRWARWVGVVLHLRCKKAAEESRRINFINGRKKKKKDTRHASVLTLDLIQQTHLFSSSSSSSLALIHTPRPGLDFITILGRLIADLLREREREREREKKRAERCGYIAGAAGTLAKCSVRPPRCPVAQRERLLAAAAYYQQPVPGHAQGPSHALTHAITHTHTHTYTSVHFHCCACSNRLRSSRSLTAFLPVARSPTSCHTQLFLKVDTKRGTTAVYFEKRNNE